MNQFMQMFYVIALQTAFLKDDDVKFRRGKPKPSSITVAAFFPKHPHISSPSTKNRCSPCPACASLLNAVTCFLLNIILLFVIRTLSACTAPRGFVAPGHMFDPAVAANGLVLQRARYDNPCCRRTSERPGSRTSHVVGSG